MPRIARGLSDGYFYHIINRGNGRQEAFHKREDYAAFADLLKESVNTASGRASKQTEN